MTDDFAADEPLPDAASADQDGAPVPYEYAADLRLESQLCFALYSTSNKLSRLYGTMLQPFNLTLPQSLVLIVLWERSSCSVGEIAQALELDFGTVTPLVKRLEAGGFVARTRDALDERRVLVRLTPAGIALREPIIKLRRTLTENLPASLAEIEALRGGLLRFSKALRTADERLSSMAVASKA